MDLGTQNKFISISRTQRIELAETDLSSYELTAALEGTTTINIMLYKSTWHQEHYGFLGSSWKAVLSMAWAAFWFTSLVCNVGLVYRSYHGYFTNEETTDDTYYHYYYSYQQYGYGGGGGGHTHYPAPSPTSPSLVLTNEQTDDYETYAPIQAIWIILAYSHGAASNVVFAFFILLRVVLFASCIVDTALCGILTCMQKNLYEKMKGTILNDVDISRDSIGKFSYE